MHNLLWQQELVPPWHQLYVFGDVSLMVKHHLNYPFAIACRLCVL